MPDKDALILKHMPIDSTNIHIVNCQNKALLIDISFEY